MKLRKKIKFVEKKHNLKKIINHYIVYAFTTLYLRSVDVYYAFYQILFRI